MTIDGVRQILLPGELELQTKKERMEDGIFVSDDLMGIINSIDSINEKIGLLKLKSEGNIING